MTHQIFLRLMLSMTVIGGGFALIGAAATFGMYALFVSAQPESGYIVESTTLVSIGIAGLLIPAAAIYMKSARQRILRSATA